MNIIPFLSQMENQPYYKCNYKKNGSSMKGEIIKNEEKRKRQGALI